MIVVAIAIGPKHPTEHLFRNIESLSAGDKEQTGLRGRALQKTLPQYLNLLAIIFNHNAADMCRWRSDVIRQFFTIRLATPNRLFLLIL